MSSRTSAAARGPQASPRHLQVVDDVRLTREMGLGNEAALEVAHTRYAPELLRACERLLGSREEAEEALQQTFANAWRALGRADRPVPQDLRPWLHAIARNHCLSTLRARPPQTTTLPETATMALTPVEEVAGREAVRHLMSDVRELPVEQARALVLSEIGGLTHAEVAESLDRPPASVRSLVFQARTTLGALREAREAPCAAFREQLLTVTGGGLRRRALRRHLQTCSSCAAFRDQQRHAGVRMPIALRSGSDV